MASSSGPAHGCGEYDGEPVPKDEVETIVSNIPLLNPVSCKLCVFRVIGVIGISKFDSELTSKVFFLICNGGT